MTFFGLVFLHIGITEVYDDSGLMIFKPHLYAKAMAERAANRPESEEQEEGRDARD